MLLEFLLKAFLYIMVLIGIAAYMTYIERKFLAFFQDRVGPNRAGPLGLFQPIADAIKLFFKEDIIPERTTSKILYFMAPSLTAAGAFIPFFFIPIAPEFFFPDINIAVILIMVLGSLGLYGVILGGYTSGSKYSVMGGIRAALQIFAFETSLAITLLSIVLQAGSFSLQKIVEAQNIPFIFPQIIGFFVFLTAGFMETKRTPFDIPEAESELTGGFHTEYSSIKFAWFFLGEYLHIVLLSALAVTFYLGGWKFPLLPPVLGFLIKLVPFVFLFIWARASLPRFRFDQTIEIGWKILLPLSLLNFLITSLWVFLK